MDADIRAELRRLANAYLRGELLPLETALALRAYEDEVPDDQLEDRIVSWPATLPRGARKKPPQAR